MVFLPFTASPIPPPPPPAPPSQSRRLLANGGIRCASSPPCECWLRPSCLACLSRGFPRRTFRVHVPPRHLHKHPANRRTIPPPPARLAERQHVPRLQRHHQAAAHAGAVVDRHAPDGIAQRSHAAPPIHLTGRTMMISAAVVVMSLLLLFVALLTDHNLSNRHATHKYYFRHPKTTTPNAGFFAISKITPENERKTP